jgi:hypothetical protein
MDNQRNGKQSVKDVFSGIYNEKIWGESGHEFCSGSGSTIEKIRQPYIDLIIRYLQSSDEGQTVVDLGCGDMEIGKRLLPYSDAFIGVDVVPEIIKKHQSKNWDHEVQFYCLDLIEEELPDGDICLLRQVLQHLSNEEILRILPKLKKYRVVFITEHYPTPNSEIIPNKNMIHGPGVRVYCNSGVYLDKPPFDIPKSYVKEVLTVPGSSLGEGFDPGEIVTYKLEYKKGGER